MNLKIATFSVHEIGERIGVAVEGKLQTGSEGTFCEFIPMDAHPNESFKVQFRLGWKRAEAAFMAGPFAARLIEQMGNCSEEGKLIFTTFASALKSKKVKVLMHINGAETEPTLPATWSKPWSRLDLLVRRTPLDLDQDDEAQLERLVLDLVIPLFGMVAALIGVEENDPLTTGEPEGRPLQSLITRYERKKVNREACIQLKGTRCCICGFDFAEFYGSLGIGYVEIHHTKPLSSIGADYLINVETDLEPVCANCHAMAHREDPPLSVERLREIVGRRNSSRSS